jgi:hypothetical protein
MRICLVLSVPREGLARQWSLLGWLTRTLWVEYLRQLSAVTEKGRHAMVIMDGAGWHTEEIANDFQNLSVIKLRPIPQS